MTAMITLVYSRTKQLVHIHVTRSHLAVEEMELQAFQASESTDFSARQWCLVAWLCSPILLLLALCLNCYLDRARQAAREEQMAPKIKKLVHQGCQTIMEASPKSTSKEPQSEPFPPHMQTPRRRPHLGQGEVLRSMAARAQPVLRDMEVTKEGRMMFLAKQREREEERSPASAN